METVEEKKPLTLEQRIESLKQQQEAAKEVFAKCQGAIEVLEGMLAEADDSYQD